MKRSVATKKRSPIKKGASSPSINPRDVFHHAYQILSVDHLLRDKSHSGDPESIGRATLILSAFGLELLFKCLILLDGRIPPSTHRLDVLFRQLHNKHKRLIERKWEMHSNGRQRIAPFATSMGHPSDLPNAIVACAKGFEQMRYHYENGAVYYLQGLPSLVVDVILDDVRPDWKAGSATQSTPSDPKA